MAASCGNPAARAPVVLITITTGLCDRRPSAAARSSAAPPPPPPVLEAPAALPSWHYRYLFISNSA